MAKKYALLDTDFISKTYCINDGTNRLIDKVLNLHEYEFFCHRQIVTELNRYNIDISLWLKDKIQTQIIKSYSDKEIIEKLLLVYGSLSCMVYTQMLKAACNAFSRSYFSKHYCELENIDYVDISNDDYLKKLELLDEKVKEKKNLGEIKSFVLLQTLSVIFDKKIYVFCSDDKDARSGAVYFDDIRCISLLSAFSFLKSEMGWTILETRPFIESLIIFYQKYNQITFKVMESSKERRIIQVPCRQVLEEIFDDKFIELKNGMLQYKE